jgi:hypothetical protein
LRKAAKVSFFRPVIQTTQTESKSEDLLADRDEDIELILQHFGGKFRQQSISQVLPTEGDFEIHTNLFNKGDRWLGHRQWIILYG